jgi:hypothetical protein
MSDFSKLFLPFRLSNQNFASTSHLPIPNIPVILYEISDSQGGENVDVGRPVVTMFYFKCAFALCRFYKSFEADRDTKEIKERKTG